jgi:hypothetical protein
MFCTQCGTQVDQRDNFCKNCGVKIERRSAVEISAAAGVTATPASAPTLKAPPQPSGKADDASAAAPDHKKGTSHKAVIGAVGVAVLLISAASLYFGRVSSKPVAAPAPSSQREEPQAAAIPPGEPLPSSEDNKDLPLPSDAGVASLNRSEIVEAPRVVESSKTGADAYPSPAKSQTKPSGQDSNRKSRPASEPAIRGGAKPGVYETVQSTMVYENPSASADIVADIPAGVRVNVVSASGDWLEVHSRRGNPPGFIRRGDAVFVESPN